MSHTGNVAAGAATPAAAAYGSSHPGGLIELIDVFCK